MNKRLATLSCILLSIFVIAGCGNTNSKKDTSSKTTSSKPAHKAKSTTSFSIKKKASSSSTSSSSSSQKTGLNQSRDEITNQEKQNGNRPLSWEPIKSAQQAEALMTKKYGNKGWTTSHGTVAMSSPIYFSEQDSDGNIYMVYATGDIKPMN